MSVQFFPTYEQVLRSKFGGLIFDVREYGADPTGVQDSTAAIQRAADDACLVEGTIYSPEGMFSLSGPIYVNGSCGFACPGVWQLADGAYPDTASGMTMVVLGGADATWTIYELHLDGNSANQTFTNMVATTYFKGLCADTNNGTTNGCTMLIPGVLECVNFNTGKANGIGLDVFGCSYGRGNLLVSDNVDTTLWHTAAYTTTPVDWSWNTVAAHNPSAQVVEIEGASNLSIDQVVHLTDALPPTGTGADTLVFETTNSIKNIIIGKARTINGRYPISGGVGGTGIISDTSIGSFVAQSCRGSFNLARFDSSCSLSNLIADGCAVGGVSGATVHGSFELNGGAEDMLFLHNPVCINSQNNGIIFLGAATILGGEVRGSVDTDVAQPTLYAGTIIKNLRGYNPVGPVAVAVPASGTATAALPYDATFYITQATAASSVAVQGQTIAIPVGGPTAIRVPAGQTLTPTYTTAPTWVVMGD